MKTSFVSVVALVGGLGAGTARAAEAPIPDAGVTAGPDTTIVVSATRSGDAVPASLLGSSVTVIDNQDLQLRQTRILSDVLRDVPGVAVTRIGAVGDETDVRIRGSESRQVLVFVDGIKADDTNVGYFDFGTTITDEAARIEVLRGQQSSLYGSDAIGGVISVTTLSGRELPGVTLRAEGGSMGTYDGGGRIAGVSGNFDYALSASYYHTDGYAIAPGGSRDMASSNLGTTAKVNWTPAPNFKLTAVARYSLTHADFDGFGLSANPPLVDGTPVSTAIDEPGGFYRNIGWYGLIGAKWDVLNGMMTNSAQITFADTKRKDYDFDVEDYTDHGRRWRGSVNSTIRFGTAHVKHRLTVSVDGERQDFFDTYSGAHRIDALGVVAQYDVTVDDRLAISASGRVDTNSHFANDTTFRVTGSYLFPENTRIHAAYGTGVRNPLISDLYGFSPGSYAPNPNLKSESSKGGEAGVAQTLLDGKVTLDATWFDSRYADFIESFCTTATLNGQTLPASCNIPGSFRQEGVEASATARLADWRIALAYTYLDAPQSFTGLAPDGSFGSQTIQAVHRPKNIASGNVTWAPMRLPFAATVTVRYNGRQNDYAYDAFFDRLAVGLKAYTLVNLNATYDINKHVQIFGRIENLGDIHYQEAFGYQAVGRAGYGGVRVTL